MKQQNEPDWRQECVISQVIDQQGSHPLSDRKHNKEEAQAEEEKRKRLELCGPAPAQCFFLLKGSFTSPLLHARCSGLSDL